MKSLNEIRDYLAEGLNLDESQVFAFVGNGDIQFNGGNNNASFAFEYDGNIRITGFKNSDVVHFMYLISQYMKRNQPWLSGAENKQPKIETSPLSQDIIELYLSLRFRDIYTVTEIETGKLVDTPKIDPFEYCPPLNAARIVPRPKGHNE